MINNKKIVLVIPALNEAENIGRVIESVPDFVDVILVIDDGSIDNTREIAVLKGARVVSHKKNKGVGAAFKTGISEALKINFDILVNMDADGQFNPKDIEELITPILNEEADFTTASRFINKEFYPQMPKAKFWGNLFMAWFISKLTRQKFYDVSCGYRAYTKETILRLNLFGAFTYTQETFIDLAFKNITIAEIPIKVRGTREFGKSRIASNLVKYGFRTLSIILNIFRDYKPFKLFGWAAIFCFLIGIAFGIFLFIHYINTGFFSPHKWAGFASGFFIILSAIFIILGFILEMFSRMRKNQEEILYQLKKANS